MRKSEALRLPVGAVVTFGDHVQTAESSGTWRGEVVRVTPRGGVRVRVLEGRGGGIGWSGPGTGSGTGELWWIPYPWIIGREP